MENCPSGGEAAVGVAGLSGPGRGVPVGELPQDGQRVALAGDGLPEVGAAGEQAALGGVGAGAVPAERAVGVDRQGQLADSAWRSGVGGGAAAQVGQAGGGVEDAGGQAPEGGQDQAGEEAAQAGGVGQAAGFQVPAVALPAEDEALDAPAAGVLPQAG